MSEKKEQRLWLAGMIVAIVGNLIVSLGIEMIKAHGFDLQMYTLFFILSNAYFSLCLYTGGQYYLKRYSTIIIALGWFILTTMFALYRLAVG